MLRINMFLKNQIDCKSTQNLDISIYKKEEDITVFIFMIEIYQNAVDGNKSNFVRV